MSITIRKPDDMHIHLRESQMMKNVIKSTTSVFTRGVVMGNLKKPITTAEDVRQYRAKIKSLTPDFTPIMSIMLTNATNRITIKEAREAGAKVLKLIPGNTSTNSTDGVPLNNLKKFYPVLKTIKDLDMIFSGHWELAINPKTGDVIPEPERETAALPFLTDLIKDMPGLKIIAEHATTKAMIELVECAPENVAATITVHHAILTTENVLDKSGKIINPHFYCKPIAKTKADLNKIIEAMISGNPKFFFGSDSAPHPIHQKEKENPPAGIFTAPVVLPLLFEIFERHNALDRLEKFVSESGAKYYGLETNDGKITITKRQWQVPDQYRGIKVFMGGKTLNYQIA